MSLVSANSDRWEKAKLIRGPEFRTVALRLNANRLLYQAIERKTGVPWFVIAVIHEREASGNFMANIANGEPWNRTTRLVPRGRGPFNSFEQAAYDALTNCAPFAARWKDWSAGGALTLLEQYNGLGYANRGLPSPYIWSGTDQYQKGKYVADGKFDSEAIDSQLGCAGLLMAMGITFSEAIPQPPDIPPIEPSQPNIWLQLFKFILSLFQKGN